MMTPDEELKEDDIVVEIEAEETPSGSTTTAASTEDKPVEKTEDASEVIKAQTEEYEANLERERQAKKEAEERAAKAEREAAEARTRVASSEIETIEAAVAIAEKNKTEAQRAMKEAMEKGDFDAFIKSQEEFNNAHYQVNKLSEGKRALESRASTPASDPVESYISQFTPRSQNYLRQNIEFVKDKAKNKRLVAAHYEAEAEGLVPDSDAYFEFLDSKLKGSAAPSPKVEKESRPSAKSTPAAPVSRGNDISSGGSGGERKVKLTPNEARAATDGTIVWNTGPNKGKPIGVKEYARRKALMAEQNSDLAS